MRNLADAAFRNKRQAEALADQIDGRRTAGCIKNITI